MITFVLALLLSGLPGLALAQESEAPAFEEPAAEEEAPKPKKKKTAKKKEKPSKYKWVSPEKQESNYRFDAEGNPIKPKKKGKKKEKPVSAPDDEIDGVVPAEDCTLTSDTCGPAKEN